MSTLKATPSSKKKAFLLNTEAVCVYALDFNRSSQTWFLSLLLSASSAWFGNASSTDKVKGTSRGAGNDRRGVAFTATTLARARLKVALPDQT